MHTAVSPQFDLRRYYKSVGRPEVFGGYAVLWGDENHRDLQGEYFKDTYFGLRDRPGFPIPMLYHHGLDDYIGKATIGHWFYWIEDATGLYVKGTLDPFHKHYRRFERLIDKGAMGLSSGADVSTIRRTWDGHIKSWVIKEISITPVAVEPRGLATFLNEF